MNSKVAVRNVTIIAPLDLPNTDGIDPGELYFPVFQRIILHIIDDTIVQCLMYSLDVDIFCHGDKIPCDIVFHIL